MPRGAASHIGLVIGHALTAELEEQPLVRVNRSCLHLRDGILCVREHLGSLRGSKETTVHVVAPAVGCVMDGIAAAAQ